MLIKKYVPGNPDTLVRRASFLKRKLTESCHMVQLQKNYKRIRNINKCIPLCCTENDLPTIIGSKSQGQKRKKFRSHSYARNKRRSSWKTRTIWSKQKARSYKSGQKSGPTRSRNSSQTSNSSGNTTGRTPTRKTFRRAQTKANESFKDCNCWTCGARGRISTNCPENEKKGVRNFESTPDIEDTVYYQDLIQVYQFEDIPSYESIYKEEEIWSQEGSDGNTESESD